MDYTRTVAKAKQIPIIVALQVYAERALSSLFSSGSSNYSGVLSFAYPSKKHTEFTHPADTYIRYTCRVSVNCRC